MTQEELILKMAVFEKRIDILQGQNEILLGIVAAKFGKKDFMEYLKFLPGGNGSREKTQKTAQAMLDHKETRKHLSHSKPN